MTTNTLQNLLMLHNRNYQRQIADRNKADRQQPDADIDVIAIR